MKIGLQVPSFTWPGGGGIRPKLAEIARAAEEAGFDSLWVMDHFFQIRGVGPAEAEMLESYSTLGYLAGVTERMKLGTLVTGVIYRHPGLLVKTVTTLDVLSGGRAYFGLGAGWFEREALGLGVPFPRSGSALNGWRRRCRSRGRCGRRKTAPTGQALPTGRNDVQSAADQQAASADPDRGHGRTQDPAPGGPVCGCLQFLCADGARDHPGEAGCVEKALRGAGAGLRGDREDRAGAPSTLAGGCSTHRM